MMILVRAPNLPEGSIEPKFGFFFDTVAVFVPKTEEDETLVRSILDNLERESIPLEILF